MRFVANARAEQVAPGEAVGDRPQVLQECQGLSAGAAQDGMADDFDVFCPLGRGFTCLSTRIVI